MKKTRVRVSQAPQRRVPLLRRDERSPQPSPPDVAEAVRAKSASSLVALQSLAGNRATVAQLQRDPDVSDRVLQRTPDDESDVDDSESVEHPEDTQDTAEVEGTGGDEEVTVDEGKGADGSGPNPFEWWLTESDVKVIGITIGRSREIQRIDSVVRRYSSVDPTNVPERLKVLGHLALAISAWFSLKAKNREGERAQVLRRLQAQVQEEHQRVKQLERQQQRDAMLAEIAAIEDKAEMWAETEREAEARKMVNAPWYLSETERWSEDVGREEGFWRRTESKWMQTIGLRRNVESQAERDQRFLERIDEALDSLDEQTASRWGLDIDLRPDSRTQRALENLRTAVNAFGKAYRNYHDIDDSEAWDAYRRSWSVEAVRRAFRQADSGFVEQGSFESQLRMAKSRLGDAQDQVEALRMRIKALDEKMGARS